MIQIPEPVQDILEQLKANGYEAYIVGGCVRDALLHRIPKDWDITTSALPQEVKSLFCNTVDTGIQHGTVMVIRDGAGYEVTTYRIDGEYTDGRHPSSVTFTRSLSEDLKRRDFTINAFAWDENGLVDLFDGWSDLQNGIIRCVGDPQERFREDALRIMRAVRFSAQLGFSIEERTAAMMRRFADRLADISMERIRVEWEKTLLSPHPSYIGLYAQMGMAPYIIARVSGKCFDPRLHPLLEQLARMEGDTLASPEELSWLTDMEMSEEAIREMFRRLLMAGFFLHLTPEEADQAFRYLKYDNRTREAVVRILEYRSFPLTDDKVGIKQLLNRVGIEIFVSLVTLRQALACVPAEEGPEGDARDLGQVKEAAAAIIRGREPWTIAQLAVNGTDLIRAGVPAGKKIGDFLEKILQKVMQSPTLNRKETLCNTDFLSEVEYECKRGL